MSAKIRPFRLLSQISKRRSSIQKQRLFSERHPHEKDTKQPTAIIPPGSYVEFTPSAYPQGRLCQTPSSVIDALCGPSDPSAVWKVQSSVPFCFLQSDLNEKYLKIDHEVVTTSDDPGDEMLIRQHPIEDLIQLESAVTQGCFVAIDYNGELVPPGGTSGASDLRTHFSWKHVCPFTGVPMSSAIFKSKNRTLQISSDGKVVLALAPIPEEARINLLPHGSGLFALQSDAYPLFLSAPKKDKIIAKGEIDDYSLFRLFQDKQNRVAFLSNEHKDHFLVANNKLRLSKCLFFEDSGLFQAFASQK
eukprot:m.115641 g.115641  ORF g.115641 m.115641 type:complete len:304 (+) comp37556_c0_seq2:19-930(+)